VFTIPAFNTLHESPYVFFLISLPMILLGGAFILSWYLTEKKTGKDIKPAGSEQ